VTRTQNSAVHFEQQHKTQSHGTAQISCLGILKENTFSKKYEVKVVNGDKE
jgi:hypothetical protein